MKCKHHRRSPGRSQDRPVVPEFISLLQLEAFTASLATAVTNWGLAMPQHLGNLPRCPSPPSSESEVDQEKVGWQSSLDEGSYAHATRDAGSG